MRGTGAKTAKNNIVAEWLIKQAEDFRPPETSGTDSVSKPKFIGSSIIALIGHELRLISLMTGPDHWALSDLANQHWKLQELLWDKLQKIDYSVPLAAVVPADAVPLETQCRFVAGPDAQISIPPGLSARRQTPPYWAVRIHRYSLRDFDSYQDFLLGASTHAETPLPLEAVLACMRDRHFTWREPIFAGQGSCLVRARRNYLEITPVDPHEQPDGFVLGLTCDLSFPAQAKAA